MAQILRNLYSPNLDNKKISKKLIKFIIIHYTGMKKEIDALKKLTDFNSKVSCHYFIRCDGSVLRLVHDNYISWHAGKSFWKKYQLLNKNSIGIEISNSGHENKYTKFKTNQIKSLISLLKKLKKKYNIQKENILGHSDISIDRKKDPGEKFPWKILARNQLTLWPDKQFSRFRLKKLDIIQKELFIKNVLKIGYRLNPKIRKKKTNFQKLITTAFQRKFRGELVKGKLDVECYFLSENLVK